MEWLRINTGIRDHKKCKRFARFTGIPADDAWHHIVALWLYCGQHNVDGDISDFEHEELAEIMQLTKVKTPDLKAALLACKLVDKDGRIHNWEEYTSQHRGARERMRRWRARHTKGREPASDTEPDHTPPPAIRNVTSTVTPVTSRYSDRKIDRSIEREDRKRGSKDLTPVGDMLSTMTCLRCRKAKAVVGRPFCPACIKLTR